MKFGLSLLFTTIGTAIWNTILVSVGAAVGGNWESIVEFMDVYSYIAYALIAVIGLAAVIWFLRSRRKSEQE